MGIRLNSGAIPVAVSNYPTSAYSGLREISIYKPLSPFGGGKASEMGYKPEDLPLTFIQSFRDERHGM